MKASGATETVGQDVIAEAATCFIEQAPAASDESSACAASPAHSHSHGARNQALAFATRYVNASTPRTMDKGLLLSTLRETRADAARQADALRLKTIASLRKSVQRSEAISFERSTAEP